MLPYLILSLALSASPNEIVVVRPKAFAPALENWSQYRKTQGLQVIEIDSAENPMDVRASIKRAVKESKEGVRFIVLAADAPSVQDRCNLAVEIPTFYLASKAVHKFGSEATIASDLPYSDLDGDGNPEIAIGRIPADSPEALRAFLQRVIAYERSTDFGPWRHRVDVVAGVGGFGPIADGAIELIARRFLTEGIPDEYSLGMTYASPTSAYCPNPFDLGNKLMQRLNAGSLLWIYIGHGHIDTLDRFRFESHTTELLNAKMLDRVRIENGPPIAIFLACYTGAFDAPIDSLAEQLVMLPRGPIAALAGTRMTMPYGMSALGAELLDACFQDRVPTLGELMLEAKLRMQGVDGKKGSPKRKVLDTLATAICPEGHNLDDERTDHLHLLHVLGDPTTAMRYPSSIELAAPSSAKAGERIHVTGKTRTDAKEGIVELAYRRDQLPPGVHGRSTFRTEPDMLREMDETYRQANDLVIDRCVVEIRNGVFVCEFTLPSDPKGKLILRAFANTPNTLSCGSMQIRLQAKH